jgi:hypothetical protein
MAHPALGHLRGARAAPAPGERHAGGRVPGAGRGRAHRGLGGPGPDVRGVHRAQLPGTIDVRPQTVEALAHDDPGLRGPRLPEDPRPVRPPGRAHGGPAGRRPCGPERLRAARTVLCVTEIGGAPRAGRPGLRRPRRVMHGTSLVLAMESALVRGTDPAGRRAPGLPPFEVLLDPESSLPSSVMGTRRARRRRRASGPWPTWRIASRRCWRGKRA